MGAWRAAAQPAAEIADLAHRLTDRDRAIVYDVGRLRALTLRRLARLHFSSHSSARDRVKTLVELGVLRRFRTSTRGEYFHVLAFAGLKLFVPMIEQERKLDPITDHLEQARPSTLRATRVAAETLMAELVGNPLLAHLAGANDFYARLSVACRVSSRWEIERWYAERETWWTRGMTRGLRPDGAADLKVDGRSLKVWFEHDTGSETLGRLVAKLDLYRSEGSRLLLIELTKPGREVNFHTAAEATPRPIVATTVASRAEDPTTAVWWKLGDPPGTHRQLDELGQ